MPIWASNLHKKYKIKSKNKNKTCENEVRRGKPVTTKQNQTNILPILLLQYEYIYINYYIKNLALNKIIKLF